MAKSPEEWLAFAGGAQTKGVFKLFIGYAPGVGKTYSMLSEAIRRKKRGEDVAVAIAETHGRAGVTELLNELEQIPLRKFDYRGIALEEMDVDAVLARKPQVVVVDELAHTNMEGSRHAKRYEDVMALLGAGINVLSTVNIQHIESMRPTVQSITGIKVRETVPDWVIGRATEVVMADLTPEALEKRMRRGDVYPVDRAEPALGNFFRRGNLIALRELALEQVARTVDKTLEDYPQRRLLGTSWRSPERIAVCISSSPSAQHLIARGSRIAERIGAEFYVVHVDCANDGAGDGSRTLEENIRLAESLRATVIHLKGSNLAKTIAAFARDKRISQMVVGRTPSKGREQFSYFLAISRLLYYAPDVDIHIIVQPSS